MAMANSPITQATEQPASSSPPSSSSESPITQVSQYPPNRHHTHRQGHHGYGGFPSTLYLDLRGTRFEIERDVLVSLPESILIVMFPNGLILGQPARTRPHPSPPQLPQPQAQQQEQQPQQQQEQPQQRAELSQQQVPPRSQQPTDQQQPSLLPSSVPSQQTLGQQQQQQVQNPTAPNQGQASSSSQHHRRQSSSDSSYYDDEDYDDDYDDDYYDDEDEEGEDEEEYESEDEEEYMSMEDQVIHVDFDPSCMAFLLNVYRQAQLAGEAHRQQQIQLMLQKQRLEQAQTQTQSQQPQQQQSQQDQLSQQDLARAQALSQSQAQTQAQTKAHAQIHTNKSNNSSNAIDSNDNTLAVDQQALDPITVSDSNASPVKNDALNTTKATVVLTTGAGSGTAESGTHNPSRPTASPVINGLAASPLPSSPMTTSTSIRTSTSASISLTAPTSQPRSSSAGQQQQQNELHRLQQQQIYQNSSSSPPSSSTSSSAASSRSSLANLSIPPASNPLLNKQAIIVLREELDYFAITPPRAGFPAKDDLPATGPVLADLTGLKVKTVCGQYLLEQSKIFTALQRNISKENNVAEQHLIDMLCVSGFSKDDEWGYRRMETGRTSIASLSLVMLKTAGDGNQMATAQKLLLFWRKPAAQTGTGQPK
ncbi:hypothetical protein BGZ92_006283 [Podila epicladia]|nr:hypothetical protein BGZ92_006283 [Podila epicladia]